MISNFKTGVKNREGMEGIDKLPKRKFYNFYTESLAFEKLIFVPAKVGLALREEVCLARRFLFDVFSSISFLESWELITDELLVS